MQKPPACSCVCPAFSCTAGRALIRSWATGRGALRWVCTLFGEASATCDALVNPANLQAFTCHPWRSRRRGPYRPVVVVRSFAARGGALRSDRVASLGACRHCRPALATARTVWQWHSGGERRGACNGGSLCGHIAHTHDRSLATAIIALHSPRAPTVLGSYRGPGHSGCDLRHRLSQTAAVRHIDRACIRFFKLRARGRPGPAAMRWPRGANRMRYPDMHDRTRTDRGRGARGTCEARPSTLPEL
jgi:hypothetical protein